MMAKAKQTYDFICFSELAYEFDSSVVNTTKSKIKRRLAYYQQGAYDPERIQLLRQLKAELYSEISKGSLSSYYGKSSSDNLDLADFNTEKIVTDFIIRFPNINELDMTHMINFAVYLYYLR